MLMNRKRRSKDLVFSVSASQATIIIFTKIIINEIVMLSTAFAMNENGSENT